MAFNSFGFVVFTLVTLVVYNICPARMRSRVVSLASLVFCAAASLFNLALVVSVAIVTWTGGRIVSKRDSRWRLAVALLAVTAPLAVFKYRSAVSSPDLTSVRGVGAIDAVLPIGLSFLTFQAISYLIDVYRGTVTAERRLEAIVEYLAFFPKVLAGPIERVRVFLPQLQRMRSTAASNAYVGGKLVLWGYFCKLVVADNVASIVDRVLKAPQLESGSSLWLALTLYAFQIYFDFLGYTNIAIGVARCFNVQLSQNFDRPYAATSLRDFWRRWHITLTSWFRDYLYVPMGGATTSGFWRFGQVLLIFLVSGVWHGATLHFVAWGTFHGFAYWMEDLLRRHLPPGGHSTVRFWDVLRTNSARLSTFLVVVAGWLLFRVSDPSEILVASRRLLLLDVGVPYFSLNEIFLRRDSIGLLAIAISAIILDSSTGFRSALERIPRTSRSLIGELAFVNWFVVTLVLLGDLGVRDFTYFGF